MKNVIIAIDGTSSTGKSTVAKALGKHFNILHIDSGAMYRAVTLFAIQNNLFEQDHLNKEKLISLLPIIFISFTKNEETETNETYLNNINIEKEIRSSEIAKKVGIIAAIPEIRTHLIQLQRTFAENTSIVMDGRDIGTTVFPNADVKLFISSSIEIRAKRRYQEMNKTNSNISLEEVRSDLVKRDEMDTNRVDSPLRMAENAIEIDNSFLSREQTIEKAIKIIEEKI